MSGKVAAQKVAGRAAQYKWVKPEVWLTFYARILSSLSVHQS